MNLKSNNAVQLINELIVEYNLNTQEPIDIENLIRKMNIRLVVSELPKGMLGASKVEGLKKLIVVSSNLYNEEQKRFTLAHELGHILIHRGINCFYENDLKIIHTTKEKENEADRFAVELLMPRKSIEDEIEDEDINFDLIKRISKKYKTSLTATAIRIAELSEENILLIYHRNNSIKWWYIKSKEIYFDENFDNIDLERLEKKVDIPIKEVNINQWVSEDEDLYSCYEETIYFNILNEYITLIQII